VSDDVHSDRWGLVSFALLDEALGQAEVSVGAAEAHGLIAGSLCSGTAADACIPEILENGAELAGGEAACDELLRDLYHATQGALSGDGLEFRPLLPDDGQPLGARSAALAAWCSGFLYGLVRGGLWHDAELADDSREFIDDLSELTGIDGIDDESDEEEAAFHELVEYVRVGVMLLTEELSPARGDRSPRLVH
jgi:hypothetical protein